MYRVTWIQRRIAKAINDGTNDIVQAKLLNFEKSAALDGWKSFIVIHACTHFISTYYADNYTTYWYM